MVSTDTPKSSAAFFFVTSTGLAPPAALVLHRVRYQVAWGTSERVSREFEQLWALAPSFVHLGGRTNREALDDYVEKLARMVKN
jgi:imidazolonepropionase-like amidohydrolase